MPVRGFRQGAVARNDAVGTGAGDRARKVFVVMDRASRRDGGEEKKGRETPRR